MSRIRGCQRPFSGEQISSTILELTITTASYVCFGLFVVPPFVAIPMALYTVAVVTVISCWAYCVFVDPALPGGIPFPRMAKTQSQSRYCAQCRKTVPGLDHHCSWLNTCVGRRTYTAFFTLAIAGTVQHALGLILGICTAASPAWRGDDNGNSVVGPAVFGSIVAFLGLVGVISFGSLASFHLYLCWRGIGTIDYVVARALEWEEKQKKAAVASLAANRANTGAGGTSSAAVAPATAVVGGATATRTEAAAVAAVTTAAPSPGGASSEGAHTTVTVAAAVSPAQAQADAHAALFPPRPIGPELPSPQDIRAVQAVVGQQSLSMALQATGECGLASANGDDGVSSAEIEAIAAEVEAGRKILEASRARFRASNPGDNVSLFMSIPRLPPSTGLWSRGEAAADADAAADDVSESAVNVAVAAGPATAHTKVELREEGGTGQLTAADAAPGAAVPSETQKWLGLIAEADNGSVTTSASLATVAPLSTVAAATATASTAEQTATRGVISSPTAATATATDADSGSIARPESSASSASADKAPPVVIVASSEASAADDLEERISPMALLQQLRPAEIDRSASALTAPAAVTEPVGAADATMQ